MTASGIQPGMRVGNLSPGIKPLTPQIMMNHHHPSSQTMIPYNDPKRIQSNFQPAISLMNKPLVVISADKDRNE